MINVKPLNCPSSSGPKLSSITGNILSDPTDYRRVVGALQYYTITRPDITYSVNQLCQFMHCPRDVHWKAVKCVLWYLKGTIDIGLYYVPGDIKLNAYYDFDWAGDPDDRHSTTGYGVFLGTNLISWSSKKQGVVFKSSTEAEYRSMAHTTAELYWLHMIFHDLKIMLPTTPNLWCDNIGAIALASNPVFHAWTKHIEIDYHFIREKVINCDIQVKHISTKDQIANVFTKGHSAIRFTLLKSNLSVCILPNSLRGVLEYWQLLPTDQEIISSQLPQDQDCHQMRRVFQRLCRILASLKFKFVISSLFSFKYSNICLEYKYV